MKVAISLPDTVFEQGEEYAARFKMSRSTLYSTALEEFLAAREHAEILRKLNEVYADQGSVIDEQVSRAQRKVLSKEEW